ncbi:MAG: hypothetical protein IJR99_03890 [Kiritimatiellae bacterium]|nr:hypothetical protein [Kiritimatiellia bacterium]
MGGNGTFAAGRIVAYRWETVGEIHGVKVLRPLLPPGQKRISQKLPEESHSSQMYLMLHGNGTFAQLRIYDRQHRLRLELAYHPEANLDKSHKDVLHYHIYTQPGFKHGPARLATPAMIRRFGKYLKGVLP